MTVNSSEIDAPALDGSVLRARFRMVGRLAVHDLLVCREGAEQSVATAEQGQGSSDWPASPPLQCWQLAKDGQGQPLLLATGSAGRSHWSLAISVTIRGGLLFDVACLVAEKPVFLGSTYRLDRASWDERGFEGCCGALILPVARVSLRLISGSDYGTQILWNADQRSIQLGPTVTLDGRRTTVRWAYEMGIEPT